MFTAEETIAHVVDAARRSYSLGGGDTAALMRAADLQLTRRLKRNLAGTADITFTVARAEMFRSQIQIVQVYTEARLLGMVHDRAMAASQVAIDDALRIVHTLDKEFTGIATPMRLDDALEQDRILRGQNASLLQRHETSVARYGQAMIGEFEKQIRLGLVTGMGQHEVASRLIQNAAAHGITAKKLNRREPEWFPAPTSYVKERYWAERIVRTETAYAANSTNVRVIQEMGAAQGTAAMKKKILATFDQRTATDSMAVHGQVRGANELFIDGAGREYLHPPARPMDRETVIPWRDSWPELKNTKPLPPEEIAQAQLDSLPKRRQPEGEARAEFIANSIATNRAERHARRDKSREERTRMSERAKKQRPRAATSHSPG